ncbi:hypothetical protein ACFX19_000037 [Malus domestica]
MVLKKFKEIAEGPRIYQHINIIDFETVNLLRSWGTSDKVSNFIQCCNPEALYMVEMRYFFQDNKEEVEIKWVKSAIFKAHQGATYMYGTILVFHGEVRARTLNRYHDNAAIKPCSDCGSPQGPVTI